MASAVTPSDAYEGMTYQGGAHIFHGRRWASVMTIEEIRRRVAQGAASPAGAESIEVEAVLAHLPVGDQSLLDEYASFYRGWLDHPTADGYWPPISPNAAYNQVDVPVLHVSGWYDIFLSAAFENYRGMRERGGSARARDNQRIVIGLWSHSNFSGSFPEREFGQAASSDALDLTGLQLRWFDRWLKNEPNDVEQEAPVLLFIMGIDRTAEPSS